MVERPSSLVLVVGAAGAVGCSGTACGSGVNGEADWAPAATGSMRATSTVARVIRTERIARP